MIRAAQAVSERVVDNDLRDTRGLGLRDKGCRGACSRRGGHEVVTVAPASTGTVVARIVTGERYEQVAASEAAGVDGNPGYRGGVGSPEAEYLFDLASVVQGGCLLLGRSRPVVSRWLLKER